jgi:DNA-binding protein H-NS
MASILTSMRQYHITPEEITAAYGASKSSAGARRKAGATPRPVKTSKRPVAPKYRHPQTGKTWSGRGKAPRWMSAAEATGASRSSFLIKS